MKGLLKTVMPIALCTAFLAGCQTAAEVKGTDPVVNTSSVTDPVVNTDDVQEVPGTAEDVFGKAAAIRVADVADEMYEEPLQIDLTAEEVEAFLKIHPEVNPSEKALGFGGRRYVLQLLDENGDETGRLTVLSHGTVIGDDGTTYKQEGEFKDWITDVETSHDISRDTVCGRRPGADYFVLLSENGCHSDLVEWVETNFDDGIDAELTNEDVTALREALQGVTYSDTTTDVSYNSEMVKYSVDIFSGYGASLYTLRISENGDVYNEAGYEITGGSIHEWVQDMLVKYAVPSK